jgi:hypothetical protein
MTKSFKMVLLEAFQELDGWATPPSLERLAQRSRAVIERRRPLLSDLPETCAPAKTAPAHNGSATGAATRERLDRRQPTRQHPAPSSA